MKISLVNCDLDYSQEFFSSSSYIDILNEKEKLPDRVNLVSGKPLPEFVKARILLLTRFLIFSLLKEDIVFTQ